MDWRKRLWCSNNADLLDRATSDVRPFECNVFNDTQKTMSSRSRDAQDFCNFLSGQNGCVKWDSNSESSHGALTLKMMGKPHWFQG